MRAALIPLVFPLASAAQSLTPTLLTTLSTTLNETSGLLHVNGEVWTHLDSGHDNILYGVDPVTGDIVREVVIANADNVDWEDITTDGSWVYVGDFGNNSGDRMDLRVYRFPLDTLLDIGSDSVMADTIRFSYPDQADFTPAYNANNWDCEAFIAMDDSLFLFSKNWIDGRTFLYALAAAPGDHSALRLDSLDAQGLVTGATFDVLSGAIALIGYTNGSYVPFVWELSGYGGHAFFDGSTERRALTIPFVQTEGIAWNGPGTVLISNEESPFSAARLWELQLSLTTGSDLDALSTPRIFPVPATSHVRVTGADPRSLLRIIDVRGGALREERLPADGLIGLSDLAAGYYLVELSADGRSHHMPLIIAR